MRSDFSLSTSIIPWLKKTVKSEEEECIPHEKRKPECSIISRMNNRKSIKTRGATYITRRFCKQKWENINNNENKQQKEDGRGSIVWKNTRQISFLGFVFQHKGSAVAASAEHQQQKRGVITQIRYRILRRKGIKTPLTILRERFACPVFLEVP